MEFLYIDESGDNGLQEGSSEFYILAGLAIESFNLRELYWEIREFRKWINKRYGLEFQEIKGSDIFYHRGPFFNSLVAPSELEEIHKEIVNIICESPINLFASIKSKKEFKERYNPLSNPNAIKVFTQEIWRYFLSSYEEHLLDKSRQNEQPENRLVYVDSSNSKQEGHIRKIVREYFHKEPKFPGAGIVEYPVFLDSHSSYFIQLSDILAFTISRLVCGKGNKDIFAIDPEIAARLKTKIKGKFVSL